MVKSASLLTDPAAALASVMQAYVTSPNRSAPSFLQSLMDGDPNFWMADGFSDPPQHQTGLPEIGSSDSRRDIFSTIFPAVLSNGADWPVNIQVNINDAIFLTTKLAESDIASAVSAAYSLLAVCAATAEFSPRESRNDVLRALAGGKKIAALAVAEPESGSDAAAMKAAVSRDGAKWRISGRKVLVTNGTTADYFLVVVSDTVDSRSCSSAFLVPSDRTGIKVVAAALNENRFAHGLDLADIELNDVLVSESDLVGDAGGGNAVLERAMGNFRLALSSIALVPARAELDTAKKWISSRMQFGKPLIENADVRERLAVAEESLRAARTLSAFAGHLAKNGREYSGEAAAAKIFCTETAAAVLEVAAQLRGGAGYGDAILGRRIDAVRGMHFMGGANEVLRLYVAVYGGRFTTQFALDADAAGRGVGAKFAGVTMKARRGLRSGFGRLKLPAMPPTFSEAAGVFKEMVRIMGERNYQILGFLKNDAPFHAYEMKRLADMAIETLVVYSVLAAYKKDSDAPYVNLRAGRAWNRFIRYSKELFLSDEQAVEGILEQSGGDLEQRGGEGGPPDRPAEQVE